MNERIKLLAEQAGMNIVDDKFSTYGRFAEKFAEAIVQECIDKIETHRIPVGNSAAGEMACEWTYDALKEIRDEIKQHFGIEE
jgi:hypothetical protein